MSLTPGSSGVGKPVAVLYGTFHQHTRLVAERIAAKLQTLDFAVVVHNVRDVPDFDLSACAAVVLAAPVHLGKHEEHVVDFVKEHRDALERLPAAFISVTLSEAGAERRNAPPERHAQFAGNVQTVLEHFFSETNWRPAWVKPVAGAVSYTHYNFFVRFAMKQIAKRVNAGTDTTRDYEYTDWNALELFVKEFAREIRIASRSAGLPGTAKAQLGEERKAS